MPSYENKIVQQGVYINNHLSKNSFSQKYKSELQCELRFKMAAKEWNMDKKKNGCLSLISLSVTRTHIETTFPFPMILFVSCVQYTSKTQEKCHHSNKKVIIH